MGRKILLEVIEEAINEQYLGGTPPPAYAINSVKIVQAIIKEFEVEHKEIKEKEGS